MGTNYPEGVDSFSVPSAPANTTLSSSGTSTRTHTQSHEDLGLAVEALETNAAQLTHDHSGGDDQFATGQLDQANTHQNPDTDSSIVAIHHTLGNEATQAAPGNHAHDYTGSSIFNKPMAVCTSTSRPTDPVLGMEIYETDTHTKRVWDNFGDNVTLDGLQYTYDFSTVGTSIASEVTFDRNGTGNSYNAGAYTRTGISTSWTHQINTGNYVIVAAWYLCSDKLASFTRTCTYGGQQMVSLGYISALDAFYYGGLEFFGLSNPASGSKTVNLSLTPNYPNSDYVMALGGDSMSYAGVGGVTGTVSALLGGASNPNIAVPSTDGGMAIASFWQGATGPNTESIASFSGTQRYDVQGLGPIPHYSNGTIAVAAGDAPGAASVLFTAVTPYIGIPTWCSLGVSLSPTYGYSGSASTLDNTIFSQSYVVGSSPTDGTMGVPSPGVCAWTLGANANCRCIAQAVITDADTFDTDNQEISITTGTTSIEGLYDWLFTLGNNSSPTNDAYLRMSADGDSYVRFSLNDAGIAVYYTTAGPGSEAFLGGGKTATDSPNVTYTFRALGNTYVVYEAGQQLFAIVDSDNAVNVGADFRGWGIGMTASTNPFDWTRWSASQLVPNSLTQVAVRDMPYTVSETIWQLMLGGAVPHVRAESHFGQQIVPGNAGGLVGFDTVLWDWTTRHYFAVADSQTNITVQEAGHYAVHASICWDPNYHAFDHSMVGVLLNDQDIARKNWEFVRGNGYAPGFAQTNEIFFSYYFAQGDTLTIQAAHDAPTSQWLFYYGVKPYAQTCYVELDFLGP